MNYWQFLRFTSPSELLALAPVLDRTPVHGVMLGDHTVYPKQRTSSYEYGKGGDLLWDAATPWPDVFTSIAAMAAVTRRLHFSSNVMVLPLRHPVEVARTSATVAQLSGNRYALGAGVGWFAEEFDALDVDFATRGRRYDEMLDVLQLLWSGEMVEYHGEHFDFAQLCVNPAPEEPIPVYLGGGSAVAMRRAARRADGWITGNFTADTIASTIATMRRYVEQAGRDPGAFRIIAPCHADLELHRLLRDLGVTDIVDLASRRDIGAGTTLQRKIDHIHRFVDEFVVGAPA